MKLALVLLLGVAVAAVSAIEWVEPAFVETAATSKLRGVSHTVSPHKGMVTYISPARHIQTSGIVLTPPPAVSVVSASLPRPQVLVQPVVFEDGLHTAYDEVLAAAHYPSQVEHDLEYAHTAMFGAHHHHVAPHATHMHHGHAIPAIDGDDHGHVHGHHHHLPHVWNPVGVPAALYATPYHQPHVDHVSPISFGSIVVPHDTHGAIALEEPEYTGYNPGPVVVPHVHHHHHVQERVVDVPEATIDYTVPRIVRTYG